MVGEGVEELVCPWGTGLAGSGEGGWQAHGGGTGLPSCGGGGCQGAKNRVGGCNSAIPRLWQDAGLSETWGFTGHMYRRSQDQVSPFLD